MSQPLPPATVDLHDRLEGLERLIYQQHDNLQMLIKELLVQQTQVLDVRLQQVAEKIPLDMQMGAVCDELRVECSECSSMIPAETDSKKQATIEECVSRCSMIPPEADSKKHATIVESPPEQELQLASGSEDKINKKTRRLSALLRQSTDNLVHRHVQLKHGDGDHWLLEHPMFLGVVRTCVLANALQLGLQVDLNFGEWNICWTILDNTFTTIFALEMILSIGCLGSDYFKDKWHVLNFFVAWSSITDTWFLRIALGVEDGRAILQVFQFLRLLRMLKILQMRRDLNLLITGIASAASSMLWVVVLLFLIIYTAAILCVDVVGNSSLTGQYSEKGKGFDNISHFGTLPQAMISLFNISLLDGWSDIIWPVYNVQPFMVPFFLIFLVMTSFALLNALIGIIVEQTSAAMKQAQEIEDEAKREDKLKRVKELVHLVGQIDANHDLVITAEEIENRWAIPAFQQILQDIGLPACFSGIDLLMMLDESGSGRLSIEHFVNGMWQLIYNNEFQAQCLAQLSVSQIKKSMFELRQDTLAQLKLISGQICVMHQCTSSVPGLKIDL